MNFKTGLTLLIFSISTSASAVCVDLSGNYTATRQNEAGETEQMSQTITQTAENIFFGEGADPLSLDQQVHHKEQDGAVADFKLTCAGDSMILEVKGTTPDGKAISQTGTYTKTETGYLDVSKGDFENATVTWTKAN
jgi:hypothetical protein